MMPHRYQSSHFKSSSHNTELWNDKQRERLLHFYFIQGVYPGGRLPVGEIHTLMNWSLCRVDFVRRTTPNKPHEVNQYVDWEKAMLWFSKDFADDLPLSMPKVVRRWPDSLNSGHTEMYPLILRINGIQGFHFLGWGVSVWR